MKKLMSGLLATTLAASFAIASVVPLNAAPVFVPKSEQARSDVEKVQYEPWRRWNRRYDRRMDRYDRRMDRFERRQARRAARDFYRDGDNYYYNGYRGYRYRRDGYREYNGWWFPATAFVAGALITGAINAERRSGSAHVDWCYDRYRSYRASDNTYQPYSGPRRQCYSPYD